MVTISIHVTAITVIVVATMHIVVRSEIVITTILVAEAILTKHFVDAKQSHFLRELTYAHQTSLQPRPLQMATEIYHVVKLLKDALRHIAFYSSTANAAE